MRLIRIRRFALGSIEVAQEADEYADNTRYVTGFSSQVEEVMNAYPSLAWTRTGSCGAFM